MVTPFTTVHTTNSCLINLRARTNNFNLPLPWDTNYVLLRIKREMKSGGGF